MGNYSENPGMVRCDMFNENMKWKYTVAIDMSKVWDEPDLPKAVRAAFMSTKSKGVVDGEYYGYYLCVSEPYSKYEYPVLVRLT
jgi:hypothetical protein